MCSLRALARRS